MAGKNWAYRFFKTCNPILRTPERASHRVMALSRLVNNFYRNLTKYKLLPSIILDMDGNGLSAVPSKVPNDALPNFN
jgi:hypothetical protein